MSRKAKRPNLSNIDVFGKFLHRIVNIDHEEGIKWTKVADADAKANGFKGYYIHASILKKELGIRKSDVYAMADQETIDAHGTDPDPVFTMKELRIFYKRGADWKKSIINDRKKTK